MADIPCSTTLMDPHPLDAAAAATDEPGPPPTWAPWPSSNGSVPGKYACGLWGLSPASRKRYDAAAAYGHDAAAAAASQWAAPAPALWSSSPMATAAAAASAAPSAQQQYGFQYPFAMAAKIPPRGGDGPSHESEDFPRPLVTLPGRQPQQRPWWTGWFGKAA